MVRSSKVVNGGVLTQVPHHNRQGRDCLAAIGDNDSRQPCGFFPRMVWHLRFVRDSIAHAGEIAWRRHCLGLEKGQLKLPRVPGSLLRVGAKSSEADVCLTDVQVIRYAFVLALKRDASN